MGLIFTGRIITTGEITSERSNTPPVWNTDAALGSFTEQTAYDENLMATDPQGLPITYSLAPGSNALPGTLTISPTGQLAGDLPSVGENTEFTFIIRASDGVFITDLEFSLTVNNAPEGSQVYSTSTSTTFVIPDGVTSIQVKAWAAGGGSGYGGTSITPGAGGGGGYTTGTLSVTPGESLNIRVGAGGTTGHVAGVGGSPGGGNGGKWTSGPDFYGGGGGGHTDVRRSSTQLIVAGAGGGGSGLPFIVPTPANPFNKGGSGGGTTGQAGSAGAGVPGKADGGGGGTQVSGGSGGSGSNQNGSAGGASFGGSGGNTVKDAGEPFPEQWSTGGGGGGSGYRGGGGGGGAAVADSLAGGGGGAGSAFVPDGGSTTSASGTAPGNTGDSDYTAPAGVGSPASSGGTVTPGRDGRMVINWGPGI